MDNSLQNIVNNLNIDGNSFYVEEIARLNERVAKLERLMKANIELIDVSRDMLNVQYAEDQLSTGEINEILEDRMMFTADYLALIKGLVKSELD